MIAERLNEQAAVTDWPLRILLVLLTLGVSWNASRQLEPELRPTSWSVTSGS